jgi:hypothetical protein
VICGENDVAKDFDSLMAQMGVKPMGDGKSSPRKPRTDGAAGKKTVTRKAGEPKAPSPVQRSEALQRSLMVAKEERSAAEAKVTVLKKKVRRLKKENAALEEQVNTPRSTVAQTLEEWGFETAEERGALLRVDGWLERIIAHPCLQEDQGLRTEIEQTLVRVCARCDAPPKRTPLRVAPKRCIVCGGVDVLAAARRFADAALVNGRLRVVLVGRSAAHHRMVRHYVNDKRMVFTQVPGDVRRDLSAAQTDVDHADAVVIWDESTLSDELLAIYKSASRVGIVPAGAVGTLLQTASEIIAMD